MLEVCDYIEEDGTQNYVMNTSMTKDSCDVGYCKNGNKVCYNQVFEN